jgi:hypothetical protein
LPAQRILGLPNFNQGRFPAAFEFGGHQTIVGIDAVDLPFDQCSRIPLSLKLAFGARPQHAFT